jgi:hypothetical protein
MSLKKTLKYGAGTNLRSLLNTLKEEIFMEFNAVKIGEIVSFNPALQTAEVKIKIKRILNGEIKNYPLLVDCPVLVLSGGAGRLTLPVSAGDGCILLFNDCDIDNWFNGAEKEPNSARKHAFSDALALVGLRNKQTAIGDYLADGTELKYGASSIKLQSGSVIITNGAGSTITLNGSTVSIEAASLSVNAASASFSGNVSVAGSITAPTIAAATSLTAQGKDVGGSHKHGGVSTGGGQTGGVV